MTTATSTLDEPRHEPEALIPSPEPTLDTPYLKAWIDNLRNRKPSVGMAVGIVRDGRLESFHASGFANISSKTPIDEDTVFRIASITKTFTAIAVMQLWEQGLVELDAPANDYLRAYRLIAAKGVYQAATVRDLLTHTAGIPEVVHPTDLLRPDWGDSVPLEGPVPTLAAFYGRGIRLDREPGKTFTYSNHGYATLGQIVEDVSGLSLDRYLRERIFEPLGMADTDLLRAQRLTPRLATGYVMRSTGPRPVTDRAWVTTGAASIYSTTRDMARYISALMGGGTNGHGTILERATLETMFAPHFRLDPRVPGMGLGFDRYPTDQHLVVGHGGILPGFNSQMFVAPDDRVGLIAFTNGARLAMLWLPTELGRLLNELIGVPDAVIRSDLPHHPEVWNELCGRYVFDGRLTDVRARLMTGAGAQVVVRGDELVLRLFSPVPSFLRGLALHPDDARDPYSFRIDLTRYGLATARVVFGRDSNGSVTGLHLDLFPMSLRKQAKPDPRASVARALAASVAMSLAATTAVAAGRRIARSRPRAAARRATS